LVTDDDQRPATSKVENIIFFPWSPLLLLLVLA
jgi:hypothetical protein